MQRLKWLGLVVIMACSMAVFSASAVAAPLHPPAKVKCNAGNGNGSEPAPATDCDPGNSGDNNNGGD